MTYELRQVLQLHTQTFRKPKFELYDLNGSTTFNLASATWSMYLARTMALAASGSCTVNNADTDVAGNTIKTFTFDLDLTETELSAGRYTLVLRVTLTNGEDDAFSVPVEILDFEE